MKAKAVLTPRACEHTLCGKTFTPPKFCPSKRYCSTVCQQGAHALRLRAKYEAAPRRGHKQRPAANLNAYLSEEHEADLPAVVRVLAAASGPLRVSEVALQLPGLTASRALILLCGLHRRGKVLRQGDTWALAHSAPDTRSSVGACEVRRRPDGAVEVRLGKRAVCFTHTRATPEAIEAAARRLTEAA